MTNPLSHPASHASHHLQPISETVHHETAGHASHRSSRVSAPSNTSTPSSTLKRESSASRVSSAASAATFLSERSASQSALLSLATEPLNELDSDEEDDKNEWRKYDANYETQFLQSPDQDESAALATHLMHGASLSPENTTRRRVSVINRATMIHVLMSENKTFLMVMFSKALKRYVDGKIAKLNLGFQMLRQNVAAKHKEDKAEKLKRIHVESRRALQTSSAAGGRSEAALKIIMEWMITSKIFPHDIPPAMLRTICLGMENLEMRRNEVLFLQGDPGDRFYIIMEGKVQLAIQDNKEEEVRLRIKRDADPQAFNRQEWSSSNTGGIGKFLKILNQGIAFGELSLMDDTARTTSCFCTSDSAQLCVIDQALYNRTLRNFHKSRATTKDMFNRLSGWKTFKKWVPELRQNLADSGMMRTFNRGMVVCHKGAPLEYVYIVVEGTVTAMGDIGGSKRKGDKRKKRGKGSAASEGGINESVVINANTGERESFEVIKSRNKAGDYAVLSTVTDGSLLADVEMFLGLKKHCVDQVVSSALCNLFEVRVEDFMGLVKFSKPVMQSMKESALLRMEWHVNRWKTERDVRKEKMRLLAKLEMASKSSGPLPLLSSNSAELSILEKLRLDMHITERDKRIYREMKESGGYYNDDDDSASISTMMSYDQNSVSGSVGPYGTAVPTRTSFENEREPSPTRYQGAAMPMSERKKPASYVSSLPQITERSKSMNDLNFLQSNGGRVVAAHLTSHEPDARVPPASFSGSSISLRSKDGPPIGASLRSLVFIKHTLPSGAVLSQAELEPKSRVSLKPVTGFVHGFKR